MDKKNIDWYLFNCPRMPLFPPLKEIEGLHSKIVVLFLYILLYGCCILGMMVIGVIVYLFLFKL